MNLKVHKAILLLKKILKKYKNTINSFGVLPATKIFIGDIIIIFIENKIICSDKFIKVFYKHRHLLIKSTIISKYGDIIQQKIIPQDHNHPENNGPIWFCWLQGEEQMPEYVKLCYESMKLYGTRKVNLITISNYSEYIDLPPYIIDKVNRGLFTYTFFSDILRVNLLYKYGGLWSDSRILLTGPIDKNYFNYDFFSIKNAPKNNWYVANYRWTAGFIACPPRSPICYLLKELFAIYTHNEDFLIDFFLIDYIIAICYDSNNTIRELIDRIPFNNEYCFMLTINPEENESKSIDFDNNKLFLLPKYKDEEFRQARNNKNSPLYYILHPQY